MDRAAIFAAKTAKGKENYRDEKRRNEATTQTKIGEFSAKYFKI